MLWKTTNPGSDDAAGIEHIDALYGYTMVPRQVPSSAWRNIALAME